MLSVITSFIDYALHLGLPGLALGIVAILILTKWVDRDNRIKYLRIGSYIYVLPYIISLITTGIRSYLPLFIYGVIGLTGVLLSMLSLKEKRWFTAIMYVLPIGLTIATIVILGP